MNDTAERVSSHDYSDNYVYQRCLYAYQEAAKRIHGKVLEIGTGSGIGLSYMAPQCDSFTTIDKFSSNIDFTKYPNTTFIQMEIPPFVNIPDQSFDFVIAFQLIEHIETLMPFAPLLLSHADCQTFLKLYSGSLVQLALLVHSFPRISASTCQKMKS